jgi:glyoxylase-like metal-dependent hydrolase (beta-lactamase superfamily II)
VFRGLAESVARRLVGVELVRPDLVHDRDLDLDLGGRVVRQRATDRGHSRGDQVVRVPDASVLFTGDLVEAGRFAIFPWFPPHDTDVSGTGWLAVLERLAATGARTVVPGHGEVGDARLLAEASRVGRSRVDRPGRRLPVRGAPRLTDRDDGHLFTAAQQGRVMLFPCSTR